MRLTGSFQTIVCHGLSSTANSLPIGAVFVRSTCIVIRTALSSMVACLGSRFMTGTSTALLTDHYELTMVAAALADGTADRRCVFETFARRLPGGRRYGVVGGTGRVGEAISQFTVGEDELRQLAGVVDERTLDWLANYRFAGDVDGYAEG